jgi:hypothetical protein
MAAVPSGLSPTPLIIKINNNNNLEKRVLDDVFYAVEIIDILR